MDLSPFRQAIPNYTPVPRVTGPSAAILSMYITRVQKFEDKKNVENWDKGAESILIFTGLFSSTVATLLALSYPTLRKDPNDTTQSLLAQISQQLSNSNTTVGSSIQSNFDPPTSVVFINSVWFLSLVLSLTCALMATLLQHWARRYSHIVQGKYTPLHHARIHEYFSQGANKFGISEFVEVLHVFLHLSVFLFFAGLAVFAFRGNHIVAYCTLAIVGLCAFLYIVLSLLPLRFHDCPYRTPLTHLFRLSLRIILLSLYSPLCHAAKKLHDYGGAVSADLVRSLDQLKNKAKFSEDIITKLEKSDEPLSIGVYKNLLKRTLHWLNEDHELEEFATGIPGLYESEAFPTRNDDNVQSHIRPVLADLPGLIGSHVSLPWNIIQLAQRTSSSGLPKSDQQRRTRACLKALYHIPGAIHNVLSPYAAREQYCLNILSLLNTPESLEVIDELWDSPNDDVALSVRCVAAVVAAFMITPPSNTLNNSVTPIDGFIWHDITGERFLAKRFRVGDDGIGPRYHPHCETARLRNIVHFLTDLKNKLPFMNSQWRTSITASSILRERMGLSDLRQTTDYRMGYNTFQQHGNRASSTFLPAVQQDLITLTLEILVRDPIAGAGKSRLGAIDVALQQLEQVMSIHASEQAKDQTVDQALAQQQLPTRSVRDNEAKNQALVHDIIEMVHSALQPVLATYNNNLVPRKI
ncbi:hypothetical protein EDB87DRAFT_1831967 [Lactarius vividus]|nr:hypothetical protein EDB87DRAFT_1831967 [Lactarius vividus]